MRTIDTAPLPLSDLESHLDEVAVRRLRSGAEAATALLAGRTIWTVTPTQLAGSGVAETVAPIVGYARGLGLDVRWLVLDAPADFLTVAKRLHNLVHGDRGDGGNLHDKQRDLYEHVLASNAENVADEVHEGDVVVLHDPPTAGLARAFKQAGATVVWRCHLGTDSPDEGSQTAWAFLERYLEDVDLIVFTRESYRPSFLEHERCRVVAPSINPESPKNRVLDLDESWSVARLAGIFAGEAPFDAVPFVREDGRPGAVTALGSLMVWGDPVPRAARVVTQVSRWDRLKDMEGLVGAFADNLALLPEDAHLLLVGPDPSTGSNDPESAAVLGSVVERCSVLPASAAARVHVAAVPMSDHEVNALVVNAVQRVSDVVTQKSLLEGFGLTVAEAMWKKLPVVASRVGGIQDQVDDGVDGVLVDDPTDGRAWAQAVADLLTFPERAAEMGAAAHESVRREFLPDRHLLAFLDALGDALA